MSALIGIRGTVSRLRAGAPSAAALLTGLAQVVIALAAAGAGALLAHKFGRTAETDGFLGAYGVYIVLVLAAQAFRMVVVPDLTRAAAAGRLGGESRALRARLPRARRAGLVARRRCSPAARRPDHGQSCRRGGARRRARARRARARRVRASCSPRSRRARSPRSTATARPRPASRSAASPGLVVFAALADAHGIVALAWGLAVNAVVALTVPVIGRCVRKRALGGPWPARLDDRAAAVAVSLQGAAVPARAAGLLPARAPLRRVARRRPRHELLVRLSRRLDARRRDGVLARADLVGAADAPRHRPGGRGPPRRRTPAG